MPENWYRNLYAAHSYLQAQTTDISKLRLILGVGRTGTSWLNRVFATAFKDQVRTISEPLFRIYPEITLSKIESATRLATDYVTILPPTHPLILAYTVLTMKDFPRKIQAKLGLLSRRREGDNALIQSLRVLAAPKDAQAYLIKETHSLLATEALLHHFQCPTVLLIRNPVYAVDSLLRAFGDTTYLTGEYQYIQNSPTFGTRFLKHNTPFLNFFTLPFSKTIILEKLLTVYCIQAMFKQLAVECPNTLLIRYEDACRDPYAIFRAVSAFFGLEWTASCDNVLRYHITTAKSYKFSTCRIPQQQLTRSFFTLTPQDVELCYNVLNTLEDKHA